MQYDHGRRVSAHYYEMTPLDRAISEFEAKAKSHYTKKANIPADETAEQRVKREKELEESLRHLKFERLRAKTQIQVQCRLDEYRSLARMAKADDGADWDELEKARAILAAEDHHPTDKLANFMRAMGRPQPAIRFTAHHIVMGAGRTEDAANSRIEMHMHGIGINDPDNGVWMPMTRADKGHWAYKHAASHSQIHTKNYQRWVWANVQFKDDEYAFRDALDKIRNQLKAGKQPKQVTEKPDPNWNGHV